MNTFVAPRLVLRSHFQSGRFGTVRVPFFTFYLSGWS